MNVAELLVAIHQEVQTRAYVSRLEFLDEVESVLTVMNLP